MLVCGYWLPNLFNVGDTYIACLLNCPKFSVFSNFSPYLQSDFGKIKCGQIQILGGNECCISTENDFAYRDGGWVGGLVGTSLTMYQT